MSQAEYINELNERAAQKEQVRRFLTCIACGKLHDRDSDRDSDEASNCACRECQRKYPPSLFWAAIQVVHAAPRLRTGEVIHFSQAHIQGDFITLRYIRVQNDPHVDMPHDLDVRRDDIVWCADRHSSIPRDNSVADPGVSRSEAQPHKCKLDESDFPF